MKMVSIRLGHFICFLFCFVFFRFFSHYLIRMILEVESVGERILMLKLCYLLCNCPESLWECPLPTPAWAQNSLGLKGCYPWQGGGEKKWDEVPHGPLTPTGILRRSGSIHMTSQGDNHIWPPQKQWVSVWEMRFTYFVFKFRVPLWAGPSLDLCILLDLKTKRIEYAYSELSSSCQG